MITTAFLAEAANPIPEIPEVGRIVEVRGATWAVTDVRDQGLRRSPADEGRAQLQHVVSLQSLQEDRMGEELTVIWELEVGHTTVPDQGLPETISVEGFDDPNLLGAYVDAVRWGAVTSADPQAYQAPFRSGARVEAYQLEPLRRSLAAPRANLLLADDVGLGKTIEAGLVIEELLLRHRARSVIIVCPPSLSVKWQDEMREKFGLEFVIVDSAQMAQARRTYGLAANPFRLYPRVIVSLAWLPSVRAQRLLREVLAAAQKSNSARRYAFDILVVDEAHHVAPAAPTGYAESRGYAVDSKRTIAVRQLAEQCEHRLFLSATPHNGYSESFTALLEMIDPHRFARGADIDEKALDEITVRRLKSQIKDKGFKRREIKYIPFATSTEEEANFAKLD
ncbi:MAG: DEAD/DEAH box helicase, partial [Propionibacteriaceae bacterium]|nr:DEAD/DEAH box helicase [Propionibacteriaceae bacterium]